MRKNLSKKVVGLTLTTAMIASLTACNSSTSNDPTQPSTKGTDTETTSQAETTTEETTLHRCQRQCGRPWRYGNLHP